MHQFTEFILNKTIYVVHLALVAMIGVSYLLKYKGYNAVGSLIKEWLTTIFWFAYVIFYVFYSKRHADFGTANPSTLGESFGEDDSRLSYKQLRRIYTQQFILIEVQTWKYWLLGGAIFMAFTSFTKF